MPVALEKIPHRLLWPHRPALAAAGLFAGGIYLTVAFCNFDWRLSAGGLAGCLFGLLLFHNARRYQAFARLCLGLAWVAGGSLVANRQLHISNNHNLVQFMQRPRETFAVRGRICRTPVILTPLINTSAYWRFDLALESIQRLPDWQAVHGQLRVSLVAPTNQPPEVGSLWEIYGVITDRAWAARKNQPSVWDFHACPTGGWEFLSATTNTAIPPDIWRYGQRFVCRADPNFSRPLAPPPAWQVRVWFARQRKRAADLLTIGLDKHPEISHILQALALGYQHELPPDARRRFVATGTLHLFAISGMHMALLAVFITTLLRLALISRIYWFLWTAPVLAIFTCLVGAPASAVRGSIMTSLWLLGPLVGRRSDGWSAWAIAALAILAVQPEQLFTAGFLLSFSAAAGLLCSAAFAKHDLDDTPTATKQPPRRIKIFKGWLRIRLRGYTFTAVLAWIATLPLTVYWFNLWSPLAVIANIPLIPLASLMLGLALLAIFTGSIWTNLAGIFNIANIFPTKLTQLWLGFIQALPYCQRFAAAPPRWIIFAWYVGLGMVAWQRLQAMRATCKFSENPINTPSPFTKKLQALLVYSIAAAAFMLWPAWNILQDKNGWINIINADGMPVIIGRETGIFGKTWLINAGDKTYTGTLARYLSKLGVNAFDTWIFTGMQEPYFGAAPYLMNEAPRSIGQVIYPGHFWKYRRFNAWIALLAEQGVTTQPSTITNQGIIGNTTSWNAKLSSDKRKMEITIANKGWCLDLAEKVSARGAIPATNAIATLVYQATTNHPNAASGGKPIYIKFTKVSLSPLFEETPEAYCLNLPPNRQLRLQFKHDRLQVSSP